MQLGTFDIQSKYVNCSCEIEQLQYGDGSPALKLSNQGEPMAVATVCIDVPASDGHVWLKGWSENEGIPEALESAGVIKLTGRTFPTGFVEAQEGLLLPANPSPEIPQMQGTTDLLEKLTIKDPDLITKED